jgi:hypothetical protein
VLKTAVFVAELGETDQVAETDRVAEHDEGYLSDATRQWIQQLADRHYGGDWGRAAAALLEAAHAAALAPENPWAGLDFQLQRRPGQPAAPSDQDPQP